jgi:mannose-6-phosphate isomerase-like protein (cupin superfamily)
MNLRTRHTEGDPTMRYPVRRIVTGHNAQGDSVITHDDDAPNFIEVTGWPGLYVTEMWVTNEMPVDNMGAGDQGARPMRHDPTPGGTIFRVVEIPPESAGEIDTAKAFETMGSHNKPSAKDSARHASMHKTNSVDYLFVASGEMHMVMEDGETLLRAGDCIVQRGTNHAWVNKTDKPCVLIAVLVDAKPAP